MHLFIIYFAIPISLIFFHCSSAEDGMYFTFNFFYRHAANGQAVANFSRYTNCKLKELKERRICEHAINE